MLFARSTRGARALVQAWAYPDPDPDPNPDPDPDPSLPLNPDLGRHPHPHPYPNIEPDPSPTPDQAWVHRIVDDGLARERAWETAWDQASLNAVRREI